MNLKHIVIHCSDSPHKRGDSAGTIHQWHLEKGFDGIGYHYVVDENGRKENGRPVFLATKSFWVGAHARRHNSQSIGICLIGKNSFTELQMQSLKKIVKNILKTWPEAKVVGHCDLDSKKPCPNFNVKQWWESVKDECQPS